MIGPFKWDDTARDVLASLRERAVAAVAPPSVQVRPTLGGCSPYEVGDVDLVPCPTCNARPGEECHMLSDPSIDAAPHGRRFTLANAYRALCNEAIGRRGS